MNDSSLAWLNSLPRTEAEEAFTKCCGAAAWRRAMAGRRPFADVAALHLAAEAVFDGLSEDDWREAFARHPRIGDLASLRMKFAGNKEWSAGEQQGVSAADEATIRALAAGNDEYFTRFGHIFIVCATGRSAAEMLALLTARLHNRPEEELVIAAAEQRKITHLRIDKLEAP